MEERLLAIPQSNFQWLDQTEQDELTTYQAYGEAMLCKMPNNTNLIENVKNLGVAIEHTEKLYAKWIPTKQGGLKKNIANGTIFRAHGTITDPCGMARVCSSICDEIDTILRIEQEESIPKNEWEQLNKNPGPLLHRTLQRTPKH
jgi:hypothetical protein